MGQRSTYVVRVPSSVSPARGALFREPRPAVAFLLTVDVVAMVLLVASPWLVPVTRSDATNAAILLAVSVLVTEVGYRIERLRRAAVRDSPYVSLHSLWVVAGVLLLPPALLGALIVVSYLHAWLRNRTLVVHRWWFSASSVVLAAAAAAAVVGSFDPAGYPLVTIDSAAGLGAVVLACVTYSLINLALVAGAILLSAPYAPASGALGDPETHVINAATIGLGVALAAMVHTTPWLTPVLAASVLGMHRGLLLIHRLQLVSRTDPKTGIANSTAWFEAAERELRRSARTGELVGVLVLDLDHFKLINDEHGHLTGDVVLRAVAEALADEVRGHDVVGRVGGEEFAVLLPGVVGLPELVGVAERLRARVGGLAVPVPARTHRSGRDELVSGLGASVGASLSRVHGDSVDGLLLAADTACYDAKWAGRNRVRLAAAPVVPSTPLPTRGFRIA